MSLKFFTSPTGRVALFTGMGLFGILPVTGRQTPKVILTLYCMTQQIMQKIEEKLV